MSCEPLPWWTSKSTTAARVMPYCFCAWRAAIAALLNRQNPIGRAVSVWWPGGRVATKALVALPVITSSTAWTAPPAARNAASKLPGDMLVSASSPMMPSFGVASRIAVTYSIGWQSAMVSSEAVGASTRASVWNFSCSSTRSMARSRSGRSGWPVGVRWSRQAGWVIKSVVIGSLLPAIAGDAHAGRRRDILGHEEGGRPRRLLGDPILLEVGDALAREERIVDQELAGELPRRLVEDAIGRLRHDLGPARHAHDAVATEQVLDRGGGDGGARPQRVHRDARVAQFAGQAQHHQAHAVLGDGVAGAAGEPMLLHVERRRVHQDVRVLRLLQMRDG